MHTFLWHDYETFGVSACRDRPSQFAAIRTDAELNPVGEPVSWFCQPQADYLPDPEACLLTGITPQHCRENGLPEHEFANRINQLMGETGTISTGYNSYHFDDEVSRYLFWRNLIDPYAREWQNQCGRWDLLNVARAAWALRPDGVQWPLNEKGQTSFRLEHLAAANGLLHEQAHDALSDVQATIALARRLRDAQPRLFDYCLALRQKNRVQEQVNPLAPRPFLHITGMVPVERGCMMLAWPVAAHPTNKNEIIVWDLAHDPEELFGMDASSVSRRLFSKKEQLDALGEQRLPLKTIHLNRAPVVISQLKTISASQAERYGMDFPRQLDNAAKFAHAPDLSALWPEVWQRKTAQQQDVDCDLYQGFIGQADRRTLESLRQMDGATLAGQTPWFEDRRLDELLFRYRARNFPATLDPAEQQRWQSHCAGRLLHGANDARSIDQVMEQIETLAGQDPGDRAETILGEVYDYAESLAEQVSGAG